MPTDTRTCGEISCDECNDRYAAACKQLTQLRAERDELKLAADYNSDFMGFMNAELAKLECLCGKDHSATMPMCWPELIRCIVAKAVHKATKERDEAVVLLERAVKYEYAWACPTSLVRADCHAFLARLRAASQEQPQESKP